MWTVSADQALGVPLATVPFSVLDIVKTFCLPQNEISRRNWWVLLFYVSRVSAERRESIKEYLLEKVRCLTYC